MDSDGYRIPASRTHTEIVVEKSRFIAVADRVRSRADMDALVELCRSQYPKASHYCWAFVAGAPGDSNQVGLSDDGEPHGTAGQPMLTALLHSVVGEVGVVVIRYFGGTKLGKGGLGRAYADATNKVLDVVTTEQNLPAKEMTVFLDYAGADRLERWLTDTDIQIVEREFTDTVTFRLRVPLGLAELLEAQLFAIGAGQGRPSCG